MANNTSTKEPKVAGITTGFDRVRRSLVPQRRLASTPPNRQPMWNSGFVAPLPEEPAMRLADFGYAADELHGTPGKVDDVAMAGPMNLLTEEGNSALRDIAEALGPCAVRNDYVVSRRLRNIEHLSPFVHSMLRDGRFLLLLSKTVGVPLVPHPLRDPSVQINYYSPPAADSSAPEVAKWHLDGMNYVFTMVLADHADYVGGDYIYFRGHRDEFENNKPLITELGEDHPKVFRAGFSRVGDTMFTRGSRVYHAVTPMTEGFRMTLAMSMFCPDLGNQDENDFWHSAPDDGLARTLKNYAQLRWAVKNPDGYCRRNGIPRITWEDVTG